MRRIRILFLSLLLISTLAARGQAVIRGKVIDGGTREAIAGVHLIGYGDKPYGNATNAEGDFVLQRKATLDSIRVSCIGYTTVTVYPPEFDSNPLVISLQPFVTSLEALIVNAPTPQHIIREAVRAISRNYCRSPFQVRGFYREQIKNDSVFYSVAEAVFESQLLPGRGEDDRSLLKLVQGRRSETVRSSRIFEDYHPGGGPNYLMSHTLEVDLPEFLQESHFKEYIYSIDSITSYEGKDVYVIGFDQLASLKKNLWTGTIFVDAETYAFIEINFALSNRGIRYRKHLSGKDTMMAGLLGIDFVIISKASHYSYHKSGTKWSLHEARLDMDIDFKQPRKGIDERFSFTAEMLAVSQREDSVVRFSKSDVWHKNQLVKDLPGEFDEQFWGSDNYIQPDRSLIAAVASMDGLRAATLPTGTPNGWKFLHPEAAKAYQRDTSVLLKPYMESRWKDLEQGPYLWNVQTGDFEVETRLRITRAGDTLLAPNAGFQAGGIMIRIDQEGPENYVLLGLGCMGNPSMKLIGQNTINGNSAIHVTKVDGNEIYMRMKRTGDRIELQYRPPAIKEWKLLREVTRDNLPAAVQVGIAGFSYFPGHAPNKKPDILIHAYNYRLTYLTK